jgi:hypothetical protein
MSFSELSNTRIRRESARKSYEREHKKSLVAIKKRKTNAGFCLSLALCSSYGTHTKKRRRRKGKNIYLSECDVVQESKDEREKIY